MTITLPRLRFLAPLFAASVFCASALGGYFPSGSAGALIACFLLFLLTAAVRPTPPRMGHGRRLPAALFAFFRTVGYSYDTTDSSDLLLKNAQTMLRGAAAMAALFAAALCAVVLLFRLARRAPRAREGRRACDAKGEAPALLALRGADLRRFHPLSAALRAGAEYLRHARPDFAVFRLPQLHRRRQRAQRPPSRISDPHLRRIYEAGGCCWATQTSASFSTAC